MTKTCSRTSLTLKWVLITLRFFSGWSKMRVNSGIQSESAWEHNGRGDCQHFRVIEFYFQHNQVRKKRNNSLHWPHIPNAINIIFYVHSTNEPWIMVKFSWGTDRTCYAVECNALEILFFKCHLKSSYALCRQSIYREICIACILNKPN